MTDHRDQIRARLNVLDVVRDTVPLRRTGREWVGLCPFHTERSPSFTVSEPKQSWYCFGCQMGGDLFRFVELRDKVQFPDAVRHLAELAGVELPERSAPDRERTRLKRAILDLNRQAAAYYEYVLRTSPAGEPGRALLSQRGVDDATARRFGLGYAPGGENLANYLTRKGAKLSDSDAAGLVRRGKDYFQQRLVIPVRDERGQVLAFVGRTVLADEPRKYVNTSETPAYSKGRVLFGLDLARSEIEAQGHAVLVEGQFDVITANQYGVCNAVASSGTALTDEQVALLRRFTDEVILALDNDLAGHAAALRVIEMAQRSGVRVRVARLPETAKDPDEFLRSGGSWASLPTPTGWEFWLRIAADNPREKALREIYDVLGKIADPVLQDEYRRQAALLLGADERLLQLPSVAKEGDPIVSRSVERRRAVQQGTPTPEFPSQSLSAPVAYLLRVLAVRPDALERVMASLAPNVLEESEQEAYLTMVSALAAGRLDPSLADFPPDLERLIREAWACPPPSVDDEVVDDVMRRIAKDAATRRRRNRIASLREAERQGDRVTVERLSREIA